MKKGLKKILETLKVEPSNRRLEKRFLSLVRELSKEEQKEIYTEYARVFSTANPVRALHILHKMNKLYPDDVELLTLVQSCMLKLGRLGKAEVIGFRIKSLSGLSAGEPSQLRFESDRRSKQPIPKPEIGRTEVAMKDPNSTVLLEMNTKSTVVQGSSSSSKVTVATGEAPKANRKIPLPVGARPKTQESVSELLNKASREFNIHKLAMFPNSEMIVFASVKRMDSVAFESIDTWISKNKKSPLVISFIKGFWMSEVSQDAVEIFEKYQLTSSSPENWGIYLDHLLVSSSSLIAYRKICQVIQKKKDLKWCKIALPRLEQIFFRQKWYPFEWKESDGLDQFFEELAKKPVPKLGALLVA